MSKYSATIKGKVLPYTYKKNEVCTNFYIGDIFLGQIFKMHNDWSVVSWHTPKGYNSVSGLKTKTDCCEWLIKMYRVKEGLYE